MKTLGNVAVASALVLACVGAVTGCSQSSKQSAAQPTSKSSTSAKPATSATSATSAAAAATSAISTGLSLVDQLGGMSNVTQLADAFGANIAADPALSKSLDAASITQVKNGLVNDVAKASGMPAPNGTADLMSALSGKGLDATGVSALTSALSSAADKIHLGSTQKTAVMGLVTPMLNQLVGR